MNSALLQSLQIFRANASHAVLLPESLELVDRTQGIGILSMSYLEACLYDADAALIIAQKDNVVVGVASARVLAETAQSYYFPFGTYAVRELFRQHRVGSLEAASVLESLQGQGIGQELARRRIDWLKDKKCSAVIGVSWESGLAHTSARVFEKLHFKRIATCKDFYAKDSLERGFICTICGAPPCRCAAYFYVLNL